MPRVIHFEIPADDTARAVAFYTGVFGWQASRWDGPVEYWLLSTGDDAEPGINGAIYRREAPAADSAAIGMGCRITVDVADLDATVESLEAQGGRVVAPRMAVPHVGWAARFIDTEGNEVGLMQGDPNAA